MLCAGLGKKVNRINIIEAQKAGVPSAGLPCTDIRFHRVCGMLSKTLRIGGVGVEKGIDDRCKPCQSWSYFRVTCRAVVLRFILIGSNVAGNCKVTLAIDY